LRCVIAELGMRSAATRPLMIDDQSFPDPTPLKLIVDNQAS
jgi:hypothetical protein